MEDAANRIGAHLTEVEIGVLLEAPNESQIVDRANRHLDDCKSCQLLLEHYAAKPDDWKRFVSVMEEQKKYRTSTPGPENADQASNDHELPNKLSESGRNSLSTVAITAIVAVMAIGSLFRFPEVVGYWQNGTQAEPSSAPAALPVLPTPPAPSAPPAPTNAPNAPMPTNTPELDIPH